MHVVPSAKLPSGHTVLVVVTLCTALHFVLSFASWVNPVLQVVHTPVPSVHCVQPSAQTLQSPVDVRKNPGEHWAHAVPLEDVVHPGLHAHCPFDPHSPLRQLHVDGAFEGRVGTRHRPEPVLPWSHDGHPAGHAWHLGPKNPWAQDSQEEPVKPVGQLHVPEEVQTPEPAHGGEQAED